jgi:hypothetical protein
MMMTTAVLVLMFTNGAMAGPREIMNAEITTLIAIVLIAIVPNGIVAITAAINRTLPFCLSRLGRVDYQAARS